MVFFDWIRQQVEEAYRSREAEKILVRAEKAIPPSWRVRPVVARFLTNAAAWRRKARILDEFHRMNLSLTGLVWLPDDAGIPRIAIVNGAALEEGKGFLPRDGRKDPASVTLLHVSRDRHALFEYKGLSIKLLLGK